MIKNKILLSCFWHKAQIEEIYVSLFCEVRQQTTKWGRRMYTQSDLWSWTLSGLKNWTKWKANGCFSTTKAACISLDCAGAGQHTQRDGGCCERLSAIWLSQHSGGRTNDTQAQKEARPDASPALIYLSNNFWSWARLKGETLTSHSISSQSSDIEEGSNIKRSVIRDPIEFRQEVIRPESGPERDSGAVMVPKKWRC